MEPPPVTEDSAGREPGRLPQARLITISAAYGAGGSVVAPALAERLGVPFVDRITGHAGVTGPSPSSEQLSAEEAGTTPVHRLLGSLSHAMPAGPTLSPPTHRQHDDEIRDSFEAEIVALVRLGGGVVLGRAAAVVLGPDRGFHVRLDGPPDRRLAQGAVVEGISIDEARVHMQAADKARTSYVRRLYGVDPTASSHYHLVIDSTAVPLGAVVELILLASAVFTTTGPQLPASPQVSL
jgi:cytidylate kinase